MRYQILAAAVAAPLVLTGCQSIQSLWSGTTEPTIDVDGVPFPVLVSEAREFCPETVELPAGAAAPPGAEAFSLSDVIRIVNKIGDGIDEAEAKRGDVCAALAEYDATQVSMADAWIVAA